MLVHKFLNASYKHCHIKDNCDYSGHKQEGAKLRPVDGPTIHGGKEAAGARSAGGGADQESNAATNHQATVTGTASVVVQGPDKNLTKNIVFLNQLPKSRYRLQRLKTEKWNMDPGK